MKINKIKQNKLNWIILSFSMLFSLAGLSTSELTPPPCTDSYDTIHKSVCDSFTWVNTGETYVTTGSYSDSLTSVNGCDSIITLKLKIEKYKSINKFVACDSVVYKGVTYKSNYYKNETFVSQSGCDSIEIVDIKITSSFSIDVKEACDSFVWINGKTYKESNYTDSVKVTNSLGCDSIVKLSLKIHKTTYDTIVELNVCDSYTSKGGTNYYVTGIYTENLVDSTTGCNLATTYYLQISNSSDTTIIDSTVCDKYVSFTGKEFFSTGIYSDTINNLVGCDSLIYYDLTIGKSSFNQIYNYNVCDSLVSASGKVFKVSGSFFDTIPNSTGCDSVINYELRIGKTTYNSIVNHNSCDSYTSASGKIWRTSGIYKDTIRNSTNCDSIISYDLIINHTTYDTIVDSSVCDSLIGKSGKIWKQSGSYLDTLTNTSGCDSVTVYILSVNYTSYDTIVDSAVCDSLISKSGKIWKTTGIYIDTIVNSSGCDSITLYELVVNYTTYNSVFEDSVCDKFVGASGNIFTQTGVYIDTIPNLSGCDSITTYTLTIGHTSFYNYTDTICDSFVSVTGKVWNTSDTYIDSTVNESGCDSVIVYRLEFKYSTKNTITNYRICDSFVSVTGKVFTQDGIYKDTISNTKQCDSVITYDLRIGHTSYDTIIDSNICDSYTSASGKVFTQTGIYMDTIMNLRFCDSITTYKLVIGKTTFDTITKTAVCDSFVSINGKKWTQTGVYYDTIVNSSGCDSLLTYNLTIGKTSYDTISDSSSCNVYTSLSGKKWTVSGIYKDTTSNTAGCMKINTYLLKINHTSYDTVTNSTVCNQYEGASGMIWTTSGIYNDTVANTSGCDSVITYKLTIGKTTFYIDTVEVCDTYQWINGVTYNQSVSGIKDTITNAGGCDSIVVLELTINSSDSVVDSHSACDSFTWINMITYTSSNVTDSVIYANSKGCDSIVYLDLTIFNSTSSKDTVVSCDYFTSASGKVWNKGGDFTDTVSNISGCDSVISYNLTIVKSFIRADTLDLCEGEIHQVGTKTYSEAGVYTDVFQTVTGCDSTIVTNLSYRPFAREYKNYKFCKSDSVQILGKWYYEDITFLDTVVGGGHNGCDSITTHTIITRTVSPPLDLGNDAVLCNTGDITVYSNSIYDSYEWNTGDSTHSIYLNGHVEGVGKNDYILKVSQSTSGCLAYDTVSIEFTNCNGVGIGEIEGIDKVQVFPNPSLGRVYLNLEYINYRGFTIQVYNSLGERVIQRKVTQKQEELIMESFPKGMYMVTLTNNEVVKTFKIVLE